MAGINIARIVISILKKKERNKKNRNNRTQERISYKLIVGSIDGAGKNLKFRGEKLLEL